MNVKKLIAIVSILFTCTLGYAASLCTLQNFTVVKGTKKNPAPEPLSEFNTHVHSIPGPGGDVGIGMEAACPNMTAATMAVKITYPNGGMAAAKWTIGLMVGGDTGGPFDLSWQDETDSPAPFPISYSGTQYGGADLVADRGAGTGGYTVYLLGTGGINKNGGIAVQMNTPFASTNANAQGFVAAAARTATIMHWIADGCVANGTPYCQTNNSNCDATHGHNGQCTSFYGNSGGCGMLELYLDRFDGGSDVNAAFCASGGPFNDIRKDCSQPSPSCGGSSCPWTEAVPDTNCTGSCPGIPPAACAIGAGLSNYDTRTEKTSLFDPPYISENGTNPTLCSQPANPKSAAKTLIADSVIGGAPVKNFPHTWFMNFFGSLDVGSTRLNGWDYDNANTFFNAPTTPAPRWCINNGHHDTLDTTRGVDDIMQNILAHAAEAH